MNPAIVMLVVMANVVCSHQFELAPPLNATVLPNTTGMTKPNGTLFNDGSTLDRMWILINNYELTEVIAIAACVMIITHSLALIAVTFKIACFIERIECCFPKPGDS